MPTDEGDKVLSCFSDALARSGTLNSVRPDDDPLAVHRRLAAIAKRGTADPDSLTRDEVRQVCYALEVRYTLFLR